MKRFFTFLAILAIPIIAILAINDAICLWLVRNSSGMSAAKVERFYNGCKDDEVIILGSSLARRGLIPSEIAPKCYNYGEDGAFFFEMSKFLLDAYNMDSVKTIIYVFDPWGFTSNKSERDMCDYVLAPKSGKLRPWEYLCGVRFFATFKERFRGYNQSMSGVCGTFIQGALVRDIERTEEEWQIMRASEKPHQTLALPKSSDANFRKILKDKGDKRIVLVIPPSNDIWRSNYDDYEKMRGYMNKLSREFGVRVIDFFQDEDFNLGDFSDVQHLNKTGAIKLSQKIHRAIVGV